MSAPTAASSTLSEIECRVRDSSPPPQWLEDQLTWLRVLRETLPDNPGDERGRIDGLIAQVDHALAGHRAAQDPVSWSAPGPGAQLM